VSDGGKNRFDLLSRDDRTGRDPGTHRVRGFNLFVIQGLTDDGLGYIARVTLPYLIIMVGFVLLLTLFPSIVTILPRFLYG